MRIRGVVLLKRKEEITLDGTIKRFKKLSVELRHSSDECFLGTEECEQIAEWLEELKDLRKWKEQEEKACDKFLQQSS